MCFEQARLGVLRNVGAIAIETKLSPQLLSQAVTTGVDVGFVQTAQVHTLDHGIRFHDDVCTVAFSIDWHPVGWPHLTDYALVTVEP
ncbi:hypothetical protein D3C80_1722540 [compost metagenome]